MSQTKKSTKLLRNPRAGAPFPPTLTSNEKTLSLVAARVFITFRAAPKKKSLHDTLAKYKLVLDDGGDGPTPPTPPVHVTRTRHAFFVRTRDLSAIPTPTIAAMQSDRTLAMVAPVYLLEGMPSPRGLLAALPRRLLVRFASTDALGGPGFGAALRELGLARSPGAAHLRSPFVFLDTADAVGRASYVVGPKLATLLAALGPVVEYDWLSLVSGKSGVVDPSDTLYRTSPTGDVEVAGKQWDMKRIGARYAWGGGGGTTPYLGDTVTMYLIDDGIQLDHPDFATATAASRVSQRRTGGGFDTTTLPLDDHGTIAAGIMFAGHNDGATSTAGWAPNATLVSIRDGDASTFNTVSSSTLAFGINFAGSSGGTTPTVVYAGVDAHNAMWAVGTLPAAITANPNVVLVIPSGNFTTVGDQAIAYSGTSASNVMIVGSTDQGTAAPNAPTASTADDIWKGLNGTVDPGSRHGPELSVVAPGGSGASPIPVCCSFATDASGYTTGNGTSLAAAHVAGIAALVLQKEGTAFTAAQVRTKIEHTAVKSWRETTATQPTAPVPYVTTTAFSGGTIGLRSDSMGYGRIDVSAVLTHDVDVDAGDLDRADVYLRGWSTDGGARPPPSGQDFYSGGDVVLSTNAALIPVGPTTAGSAADVAFDNARNVVTSTQIPTSAGVTTQPIYVFLRVVNLGPAAARGIAVTAVTAAIATNWFYPTNWDAPVDSMHVPAVDDSPSSSYYAGPLPAGGVYIARLVIPTGSNYTAFSFSHACCLSRVSSANDVFYQRVTYTGSGANGQFNNVMQRNLSIV